MPSQVRFDAEACRQMIERVLLLEPSDVTEVRVLGSGKTWAGYFDSADALLKAIEPLTRNRDVDAFYVVLNQLDNRLLSRFENRMEDRPGKGETTSDNNIVRRRWILVDVDVDRPSGISASEEEREAAREVGRKVYDYLISLDFEPENLAAMTSGNGFYVLVRVDLPNDDNTKELVGGFLKGLAAQFNTDKAHIDLTTFNASRIGALCGTIKGKGDSTERRPHRMVKPGKFPEQSSPAPEGLLRRVAAQAPLEIGRQAPRTTTSTNTEGFSGPFDMERFIAENGVQVLDTSASSGVERWYIECPFDGSHTGKDAYLLRQSSGAPGFSCSHNSCGGNHWHEMIARTGWKTPKVNRVRTATRPQKTERVVEVGDAAEIQRDLKPIEVTNRPDREISFEAWQEIHRLNTPPVLFSRGLGVARLCFDTSTRQQALQMLDAKLFLHRIRRVADFLSVRQTKDGEIRTQVPAPLRIAEDMLSCADDVARLPIIRAVIYAPIMSSTGELLITPGYHAADGLYLAFDEEIKYPSDVSKAAALAAWGRLFGPDGIFSEFPYATPTDRAHAGGLLLSLFMRPRIRGCQPMFLVEAPEMGTGKSLLAKSLLKIFDPLSVATNAPSARRKEDAEAEWTKVVGAALRHGPSTLFLDNIRGTLESTALEGLITSSDIWKTRLLGASEEISVWPGYLTIVGTSNNPDANRDMVRRSISIRIDADMERPETGRQFKIEKLEEYIKTHRAAIIGDVLTILAAWKAAGCPEKRGGEKGTFEEWSQLVGGVLAFLEVPGFLANEKARSERMDPETGRWAAFFDAWHKLHGGKRVAAAELIGLAVEHEIITANTDRDGNFDKSAGKGLGRVIHRQMDRKIGDWRLSGTDKTSGKLWRYWLSESKEDLFDNGFNGFNGLSPTLTHDPNKTQEGGIRGHGDEGQTTHLTHQTHSSNSEESNPPDPPGGPRYVEGEL